MEQIMDCHISLRQGNYYELTNDTGISSFMDQTSTQCELFRWNGPNWGSSYVETSRGTPNDMLLGYNANCGLVIDWKLCSDDLKSFCPCSELMMTLFMNCHILGFLVCFEVW